MEQKIIYTKDQQDACWEHSCKDCNKCDHYECKYHMNNIKGDNNNDI